MQREFNRLIKIKSREEVRKNNKRFIQVRLWIDGNFYITRHTSVDFTLSLCDQIFRIQDLVKIAGVPSFVIQVDDDYIAVPVGDAIVLPDIAVSDDTVSVMPQISFDELFSGGDSQ